jgi:hypothetical protein
MSDFSETWKAMSVEQRAKHIVRDWQDCRESNEPMVLRVAAVVAHAVLSEAIVELSNLRAERDEARREVCELLYNRQGGWPKEHANERGWDCFKEGKP